MAPGAGITRICPFSVSLVFLKVANVWLVLGGRMSEAYGFVE